MSYIQVHQVSFSSELLSSNSTCLHFSNIRLQVNFKTRIPLYKLHIIVTDFFDVNKLFLIRNRIFLMDRIIILHKMDNKLLAWHEAHIFTRFQPKQQYLFRLFKQNNAQKPQLRLS